MLYFSLRYVFFLLRYLETAIQTGFTRTRGRPWLHNFHSKALPKGRVCSSHITVSKSNSPQMVMSLTKAFLSQFNDYRIKKKMGFRWNFYFFQSISRLPSEFLAPKGPGPVSNSSTPWRLTHADLSIQGWLPRELSGPCPKTT